ncbi:MAG: TonB family protein [Candidatus Competibacteraceae bacterium]
MRSNPVAIRTEGQRLALALLLALAVHALLLFSTHFTLLSAPPAKPLLSVQLNWLPRGDGRPDMAAVNSGGLGAESTPLAGDSSSAPPAEAETAPASPAAAEATPASPVAPAVEPPAQPTEATVPRTAEPPPAATASPASPTTLVPKATSSRNKAAAVPLTRTVSRPTEKTPDKPVSPPAPGKALSSRPEQPGAKLPAKPVPSKPASAASEPATVNPGRVMADKPVPGKLPASKLSSLELLNRGLEIARNTTTPETQAGSPWEKSGSSPSLTSLKNFYEESWARKVERLGSIPAEALQLNLSTGPTLAVAIRADGSVQSITVLRSSGHVSIDESARRMVQAAAPYAPFPPELRRQTSVLRIVRKWKFEHGRMLSE